MATSPSRPVPRRHTHLHIVYGDNEVPRIRQALAKFLPVLEALKSDTLSITIRDLPDDGHVPNHGLAKGLKQVFDGYRYPYERLAQDGLPALRSHYDQLSRRLGYRIPMPEDDLERLGFLLLASGTSADLKAVARALDEVHAGGERKHLFLVVAHFRANELHLMREQYRLAQPVLQGWTPDIADWPKIVEAAKGHLPGLLVPDGGPTVVNPGSVGLQACADSSPSLRLVATGGPLGRYARLVRSGGRWVPTLHAVRYDRSAASREAGRNGRSDWARALVRRAPAVPRTESWRRMR